MDRYTHSNHGEQTEALNVLPDLSPAENKPIKKPVPTVKYLILSWRPAGRQRVGYVSLM